MRREFAGSSGDMRAALQKIPARSVKTTQSRTAFADAMTSIESDGDKAALLAERVPTADRELLIDIRRTRSCATHSSGWQRASNLTVTWHGC
jgi:hypothetical protein